LPLAKKKKMRACFLGQNVCALGFGVATLQTPPLLPEPDGSRPGQAAAIIPDVTPVRPGYDISRHAAHPRAPAAGPLPPAPLA